MKKYLSLFLALIMVVSSVFVFTVTAGAEGENKSYYLYKSATAPMVDGTADAVWDSFPASEYLSNVSWNLGNYTSNTLRANFKALWVTNSQDSTMIDLYLMVQYSGYYDYPSISGVRVFFTNTDGTSSWTDVMRKNGYATGTTTDYTHWKEGTYISAIAETEGVVTFEFTCTVKKADNLKLDVVVLDGTSWQTRADYSWNGCLAENASSKAAAGELKLMQEITNIDTTADVLFEIDGQLVASADKDANNAVTLPAYEVVGGNLIGWKDASGNLYPIHGTYTVSGSDQVRMTGLVLTNTDYYLLDGASILIEEPTALRFEVLDAQTATMTSIASMVQEKGFLLVETSKLTAAVLADGAFSAAELDAASIAYEKTVLTTPTNGIHYVVKNITDKTVSYSACAYITLQYADGSTQTVSLAYHAEKNARSVKDVATSAYADRATVQAPLTNTISYKFKVGKDFGVGEYTVLSFSPYTKEQLTLLDSFRG